MKKCVAPRILAAVLAVLTLVSLAACKGGEPVQVTVKEYGKSLIAEGTDQMTVKELVERAGIELDERDYTNPDRDLVWKDAGAQAISVKHYAKVTIIVDDDQREDVEIVGANIEQLLAYTGRDVNNYILEMDKTTYLTDGMVIRLKKNLKGFVKENDKGYFYNENSELQKNGIVGSETAGYYYADENGVIDLGLCNGMTIDGKDYNVIEGKVTPVITQSDGCLFRALQAVAECTEPSMLKEDKLRSAFEYLKTNYLEGVRHDPPYMEQDWYIVYCDDIFVYGKGDCYSYGAAFAYMAKGIGYEESYACTSGGHGWAEVDGLVYDPEWAMHYPEQRTFAVSYDEDTDVRYARGLGNASFEWKRVKV